ncbi:MAG: hypothetical protein ACE5FS_08820 [Paracoccaceae bacterium]
MYRFCAMALSAISLLLFVTNAVLVFATPAALVLLPASSLIAGGLPAALGLVLAAMSWKMMHNEMRAFRRFQDNYYAPLARMNKAFERKDAEEKLAMGT